MSKTMSDATTTTLPLLVIDTSSLEGSVALMCEGTPLLTRSLASGSHARELVPSIDELLKESGVAKEELALIAVSIGPGSYTGLRIGLTVAKTLALALGTKIVGVSTLNALARDAAKDAPQNCKRIIPAIDARGGHIYTASFGFENSELVRLTDDIALPPEKIKELISSDDYIFGSGAKLLGIEANALPVTPSAKSVAELGLIEAKEERFLDLTTAAPNYLRKTPAEINLEKKNTNV